MKIMTSKAVLAAALAATILGTPSAASAQDSREAFVNARAGIVPVLNLVCTPVNFGVWRMPIRSTGGTTTVTLTVASGDQSLALTTATATGNVTSVALASGYQAPDAARCTVSGSTNPEQTIQTSIRDNIGLAFGASTHDNLTNPGTPATLSADLSLASTGVAINSNGTGVFRVAGVLTLPQTIAAVNYGGYSTTTAENAAIVTVTDALVQ
jgi:hypothetical protein